MTRKWIGVVVLMLLAGFTLNMASCAHNQELVSIQVQPGVETFGNSNTPVAFDAGSQVQLRALGTYIHPPVTKDITNEVTWASNDTQMFTLSSGTPGLLTATGDACGATLVSATLTTNTSQGGISSSGALVTGYMTANVTCFTSSGGGGSGNPALALTIQGTGSGTVTSSPLGLSCSSPGPCITQNFTSGTIVTLTANPTPPAAATWLSCPSINMDVCTVDLTGNTTVTVEFQ
jgi:hypothetical protein